MQHRRSPCAEFQSLHRVSSVPANLARSRRQHPNALTNVDAMNPRSFEQHGLLRCSEKPMLFVAGSTQVRRHGQVDAALGGDDFITRVYCYSPAGAESTSIGDDAGVTPAPTPSTPKDGQHPSVAARTMQAKMDLTTATAHAPVGRVSNHDTWINALRVQQGIDQSAVQAPRTAAADCEVTVDAGSLSRTHHSGHRHST